MIRPITLVAFFAAAGSGLYLYQTKLQAQLLDQRITHTVEEIRQARQHTALLTAEYALLNDPQRLQKLSDEFLQLPPTAPSQYVTMADLASRLPPVGPPPTPPTAPEEPAPSVAAPGATPDTSGLIASAPADNSGSHVAAAARDTATRVVIAGETPTGGDVNTEARPAPVARSVIAPAVAVAARPAPPIRLAAAPAVRVQAPEPIVSHPAPPVARYTPPVARVAEHPAQALAPRPAVLHPPAARPAGQAVSMLGMAWTSAGPDKNAPGGNR